MLTNEVRAKIEKERKVKSGYLNLSFCDLKSIPKQIEAFDWLTSLDLERNQISDISPLASLSKLTSLNLWNNQISEISPLASLSQLTSLELGYTQISDISPLASLKQLTSLDLGCNKISDVSPLTSLSQLTSLSLTGNQISDISPLINLFEKGSLDSSEFDFKELADTNPITNPPKEVVRSGWDAITTWQEELVKGAQPQYECKMLLLGQGGSGKTTFCKLQKNPNYEVKKGKLDSTLGIELYEAVFSHQNVEGQKIKTHLWDFGGQDPQKMLHQFFITENAQYLLVSDKRKENTNFDYWFEIIKMFAKKCNVVVLENIFGDDSSGGSFDQEKYKKLFPFLKTKKAEVNLAETRGKDKEKWRNLNEIIEEVLSDLFKTL